MKKWRNKVENLTEQFEQNPQQLISRNPLFRNNLIPVRPLAKNLLLLKREKFNINLMHQDIINIQKENTWINKGYNEWHSITLKSKDGTDQNFLKETFLGIGPENNYIYTDCIKHCPYLKQILDNFGTDVYLVRLLKLTANTKIKYHTDETVFKNRKNIIRCHIPIITHPSVSFKIGYPLNAPAPSFNIWNASTLYERHLEAGYIWYTNVNCLHSVDNQSPLDRIHLVIDIRPTPEMLQQIYN
jgi:hypothetical protein